MDYYWANTLQLNKIEGDFIASCAIYDEYEHKMIWLMLVKYSTILYIQR